MPCGLGRLCGVRLKCDATPRKYPYGMKHNFRSWMFGALFVIAVALPSTLMLQSFKAYSNTANSVARFEQLCGEIKRLDEVLTMSARMAATSGETRWVERYNANVDGLDRAINELMTLGVSNVAQLVHATDAANLVLVGMETRSFELIQQGRRREAYALLTSVEYQRQKASYADGMSQAMAAVHASFARDTARSGSSLLLVAIFSVFGVATCFIVWIVFMRRSFQEQQRLHDVACQERDAATAANAAKARFLASMSHELRTPLNAVIGYSEMLREGAEEDKRRGDVTDLSKVIGAARRLLSLIDDLLDLSKAEIGKIVLKAHEFEVRVLVEAAASTIGPAAASRGNRMRVKVAPDLGMALTDEFRLEQCLLNLLTNAAKFTRNGKISLSARRNGDTLTFEVSDTGIGMSPAQLGELFQPFVQFDAAMLQAHGGTGLGLAITRHLVRLLGGDIVVESTIGVGTVFTLSVPAILTLAANEDAAIVAAA